jgi:subtilisin-like proprotein convertase family protein
VKDLASDTGAEPHATCTVGTSALPADGTWRLRVMDDTPGVLTVDPGHLDGWNLTFRPS